MIYQPDNETKLVLLTALDEYARDCHDSRLLFQHMLEDAERTDEVPEHLQDLYSSVSAFRSHMAERVEYFLSRQETLIDLIVKVEDGTVTIDYDDSNNPF